MPLLGGLRQTRLATDMAASTLRFGRIDTTMFVVHDERNPSPHDWSEWVRAYAIAARDHGVRGLLVISSGGGPNGRQRSEVVEGLIGAVGEAAEGIRTAICSDSRLARGIATAIGWLMATPYLRRFGYRQRNEALEFLQVDAVARPAILGVLERFEGELRRRS
jgi:hypothetical protein